MSYKPCDAAHLLSKKAKLKEEKGETIVRPNPEMSGFSFFLLCFSESHVGSTVSAEVEFHIKNIGVYEVSQDRCPGVSLHLSFACHRFLVARFLFPPPPVLFHWVWPSATKSGRPYGDTFALLSCRTPLPWGSAQRGSAVCVGGGGVRHYIVTWQHHVAVIT